MKNAVNSLRSSLRPVKILLTCWGISKYSLVDTAVIAAAAESTEVLSSLYADSVAESSFAS